MITLMRIHEGLPAEFINAIAYIASSRRRSRRINIYDLAPKSGLNLEQLRNILVPLESAGFIKYVGGGVRLLNKIEIKDSLENFWRHWVLPSQEPWSLAMDFERFLKRPLDLMFQNRSFKPYVGKLSRKPKELVAWSIFYSVFKTQKSFALYQNNCINTMTLHQKKLYDALGESGLTLAEAIDLCSNDDNLLSDVIENLHKDWLIRLIWQNENGLMRWRIIRFKYEKIKREIKCYHDNDSLKNDGSLQKMLILYNREQYKKFENKRIWEYYFELVDNEWMTLNNSKSNTFCHFMQWWNHLIGQEICDQFSLKSGLYYNKDGQFGLLLVQVPFKRYLQHAIKWGFIDKKKSGFKLTALGENYAGTVYNSTKDITAIWARNQSQLTIALNTELESYYSDWIDKAAKKVQPGRYLITPAIIRSKKINFNDFLHIIGGLIPLLPRQIERLSSWFEMRDKV